MPMMYLDASEKIRQLRALREAKRNLDDAILYVRPNITEQWLTHAVAASEALEKATTVLQDFLKDNGW